MKLNVSGTIIETKLDTLRKIDRSILADIFTGKTVVSIDEKGQPIMDADSDTFEGMLRYIEEDRTWLPEQ